MVCQTPAVNDIHGAHGLDHGLNVLDRIEAEVVMLFEWFELLVVLAPDEVEDHLVEPPKLLEQRLRMRRGAARAVVRSEIVGGR